MMEKKRFFCIDAHTCGNPVRLVAGGGPSLKGHSMMEKRLDFLARYDWIRQSLMFEPRGHDMMSGSILYTPADPENDVGVLFIETSGCLPMCGHGLIGTITIAIEEGLITPHKKGHVKVETPAGLVLVEYHQVAGKVQSVKLVNVPSFLLSQNLEIDVPGLGPLHVDIAYGGNFYAIVDPQDNYPGLDLWDTGKLIAFSREIRAIINQEYSIVHPEKSQISGCSHVMWTGSTMHPEAHGRNAVFYGEKGIDRSPCGTGTSARMAQWHAKGFLGVGQEFIHESIIGSSFIGKIESITKLGAMNAIIPSVQGWAKIFGYNNILVDPDDDPFAAGFQVI